jgi:hypothetical protein
LRGFKEQCEIPASVYTVTVTYANSGTRGSSVISAVTSRSWAAYEGVFRVKLVTRRALKRLTERKNKER